MFSKWKISIGLCILWVCLIYLCARCVFEKKNIHLTPNRYVNNYRVPSDMYDPFSLIEPDKKTLNLNINLTEKCQCKEASSVILENGLFKACRLDINTKMCVIWKTKVRLLTNKRDQLMYEFEPNIGYSLIIDLNSYEKVKCTKKFGGEIILAKNKHDIHYFTCFCNYPNIFNKKGSCEDCDIFVPCKNKRNNALNLNSWNTFEDIKCECSEFNEIFVPYSDKGPSITPPMCKSPNIYEMAFEPYSNNKSNHLSAENIDTQFLTKHFGSIVKFNELRPVGLPDTCQLDAFTGQLFKTDTCPINYKLIGEQDDKIGYCKVKIEHFLNARTETLGIKTIRFENDYLYNNNGKQPNASINILDEKANLSPVQKQHFILETGTFNANTGDLYNPIFGHRLPSYVIKKEIKKLANKEFDNSEFVLFFNSPESKILTSPGDFTLLSTHLKEYTFRTLTNFYLEYDDTTYLRVIGRLICKPKYIHDEYQQVDVVFSGKETKNLAKYLEKNYNENDFVKTRLFDRRAIDYYREEIKGSLDFPAPWKLNSALSVTFNAHSPLYTGLHYFDTNAKIIRSMAIKDYNRIIEYITKVRDKYPRKKSKHCLFYTSKINNLVINYKNYDIPFNKYDLISATDNENSCYEYDVQLANVRNMFNCSKLVSTIDCTNNSYEYKF